MNFDQYKKIGSVISQHDAQYKKDFDQYVKDYEAYAANPNNNIEPAKPDFPANYMMYFQGSDVSINDALSKELQSTLIADDVTQATRAVNLPPERKRNFKMYTEQYPHEQSLVEKTPSKQTKSTAFVPVELKQPTERSLGSGYVYKTSDAARDDRDRVQLGIGAKGVVSNKFCAFSDENIMDTSLP